VLRATVSILVVAFFGALFAGAYWIFVAQATTGPGGGFGGGGGWAVPVEAAEASKETSRKTVLAVGTLVSSEWVTVRAEVAGRVASFNLTEGKPVKEATVLVQLDPSVELAALRQARASIDLARANNVRASELMKRGSGTQRAVDEARAALKEAEASVALMEAQLERLTIVAPFAGVLGLKKVNLGDYLAPGAEIVSLYKIDLLQVEFRVPEIFLPLVRPGNRVALSVDAYPGREFVGEVYAIDPQIDIAGRAIVMRARVPNPSGELKPGLFARVSLDLIVNEGALFVPEEAIVPIGDRRFLFRVVDGKAAFTPVKTGQRRDGKVEIVEGIKPGDLVVTAGVLKIYDGAAVQPVPPVPNVLPDAPSGAAAAPGAAAEPEEKSAAPAAGG
jgi:membrane fusion protein (multidrug efflux system)